MDTDKHTGKTPGGRKEQAATCKPQREAAEETQPAATLTLDVQPPGP